MRETTLCQFPANIFTVLIKSRKLYIFATTTPIRKRISWEKKYIASGGWIYFLFQDKNVSFREV